MSHVPLLSFIIFFPVFGGGLVLLATRNAGVGRSIALITTLIELAAVGYLFLLNPQAENPWILWEDTAWIPAFGIRYSLGLDGVSLMLITLTAFLLPLCVLVSWRQVEKKVASFYFFLLLVETTVMGVFLAADLFLFYLFWEVQVIPVFYLTGIWGHENRVYASLKFALFTLGGSLFMFVALIGLYLNHGSQTGIYTFSLLNLINASLSPRAATWIYLAFLVAFAVKVPIFPVHTWLPVAHTQAPTAGSVVLAGLLLKTGTYALLRLAVPIFPGVAQRAAPVLLVVGLWALFYAAWIAFAQRDMKRLVAYSSVAHMGIVVIGIAVWNAITLNGAMLQMINHGLSTSALFILVGMLSERVDSRDFADVGGLWKNMPVISGFFLFFAMASLGLPGLNNFVGELLVLIGTFHVRPVIAILGFAGLALTLIYVVLFVQKTIFGDIKKDPSLWDATPREVLILGVLAVAVLFMGLHPEPVLELLQQPIENLIAQTVHSVAVGAM